MNTISTSLSDSLNDQQCPCCYSTELLKFHQAYSVPVNSVLNVSSRQEALDFPRGHITLGFCQDCGFIFNTCFDPELVRYCSDCEESQGYSATFDRYAKGLADDLIHKYELRNKSIVEIGCGKGEFLKLICSRGNNRGYGFDPAYVPDRGTDSSAQVTFVPDFYSEKYSDYSGDLICCRMTLEHIQETAQMVSTVRGAIGDQTDVTVFFQVPDVTRILRDCAFEDIYYEHCSYFSPGSLARLFRNERFNVIDLKTDYDDQYIHIEARPALVTDKSRAPLEYDLEFLKRSVASFKERYRNSVSEWREMLSELKQENRRVVVWGSGSKAVAFLTTLAGYGAVDYVVDINPHRQGTYMAGTGQEIVSPGFLESYRPEVVIVMNSIYRDEIQRELEAMGLYPELLLLSGDGPQRSGEPAMPAAAELSGWRADERAGHSY